MGNIKQEKPNTTITTTCVVGLVHNGFVYMGADSAGVKGPFKILKLKGN